MGLRFLYHNQITSGTMVTPSTTYRGIVTGSYKVGAGLSILTPSGTYTGSEDKEYYVEIDNVVGGLGVGQAKFKWSDNPGVTTNATGVMSATVGVALNNGITIGFSTQGSTVNALCLADYWYFRGINYFGREKLVDWDRDTRWRSSTTMEATSVITVDIGANATVKAIGVIDHNFSASAVIRVDGSASADFGGGFTTTLTWKSGSILYYPAAAQTYRYWRLRVADQSNADGFIEIGEFYLGEYFEPSRSAQHGYKDTIKMIEEVVDSPYGGKKSFFFNQQKNYNLGIVMPATDVDNVRTMIADIANRNLGTNHPILINLNSASPTDVRIVSIEEVPIQHLSNTTDQYTVSFGLKEVCRSV